MNRWAKIARRSGTQGGALAGLGRRTAGLLSCVPLGRGACDGRAIFAAISRRAILSVPEGQANEAQRFIAGIMRPPAVLASRRDARTSAGKEETIP